jgi:hypothetical protein
MNVKKTKMIKRKSYTFNERPTNNVHIREVEKYLRGGARSGQRNAKLHSEVRV